MERSHMDTTLAVPGDGRRLSSPTMRLAGVTADVVDLKTPPNPPPTVQDIPPLNQDTKKADAENPANNSVCLAMALADLPLSCPTRT